MMRVDPLAPDLREMGFSQRAALTQLAARMPQLFDDPEPATVRELAVRARLSFRRWPPRSCVRCRRSNGSDALDEHVAEVRHTIRPGRRAEGHR